MDHIANPTDAEETGPALVDVTSIPLAELLSSGDDALAHAIRRIVQELDEHEVIAAFSSCID